MQKSSVAAVLLLLLVAAVSLSSGRIQHRSLLRGRAVQSSAPRYSYETKYFTQRVSLDDALVSGNTQTSLQLDHFNAADTCTFQQRYLVNRQWWETGGPIFFYTGNEGNITWFSENTVSSPYCTTSTYTLSHFPSLPPSLPLSLPLLRDLFGTLLQSLEQWLCLVNIVTMVPPYHLATSRMKMQLI